MVAVEEGMVSLGTDVDFRAPLPERTLTTAPLPLFVSRSNHMALIELSLEFETVAVERVPSATLYGAAVSVLVVAVAYVSKSKVITCETVAHDSFEVPMT
jgi:hypothetical protein